MSVSTEPASSATITVCAVRSLAQAQAVRQLRNQCRLFLTNFRGWLGPFAQSYWFYNRYLPLHGQGRMYLYLAKDANATALAYGALTRSGEGWLVTECVAENQRGRGLGRKVLEHLIDEARRLDAHLPVIAEIWADNAASVGLHERLGFTKEAETPHAAGDQPARPLARFVKAL